MNTPTPTATSTVLVTLPALIQWTRGLPSRHRQPSNWADEPYKSADPLRELGDALQEASPQLQPEAALQGAMIVAAFAATLHVCLEEQKTSEAERAGAWRRFLRGTSSALAGLELGPSPSSAAGTSLFETAATSPIYRVLCEALRNDPGPMPADHSLPAWFATDATAVSVLLVDRQDLFREFWFGLFITDVAAQVIHPALRNENGVLDLSGWNLRDIYWRGVTLKDTLLRGCDLRGADLEDAELSDIVLDGADLTGAKAAGARFNAMSAKNSLWVGTDGTGAKVSGDLDGANLTDACFSGATFAVTLTDAILCDTDFRDTSFSPMDLRRQEILRVDFSGASLERTKFDESNLTGSTFARTELKGARFMDADLYGVDFSEANLHSVEFSGAECLHTIFAAALDPMYLPERGARMPQMKHANFCDVSLGLADISHASFQGTCLRNVYLGSKTLDGVTFAHADLVGADFTGASLIGCCFHGAALGNTIFRYADLTDVWGITKDECFASCVVDDARLPTAWVEPADPVAEMSWLQLQSMPCLKMGPRDFDAELMNKVVHLLSLADAGLEGATVICEMATEESRDVFVIALCEAWIGGGAESESRWALKAVCSVGGQHAVRWLVEKVEQWAAHGEVGLAIEALQVLNDTKDKGAPTAIERWTNEGPELLKATLAALTSTP